MHLLYSLNLSKQKFSIFDCVYYLIFCKRFCDFQACLLCSRVNFSEDFTKAYCDHQFAHVYPVKDGHFMSRMKDTFIEFGIT